MAFYDLLDGIPEKVWPDAGATILGQGLSVDNTLATARVTAVVPVSLLVTMTVGFLNVPLTGGATTLLIAEIRAFTPADVEKAGTAAASMFIDRDTGDVGLNVSMIEVLAAGEYFDLVVESAGAALPATEIKTALQFWVLDR